MARRVTIWNACAAFAAKRTARQRLATGCRASQNTPHATGASPPDRLRRRSIARTRAGRSPPMGLSRVWVEDGCILCNLCVEVSPNVFVIEGEHCWARPDADLDVHEE